jgi:hypothetical protein
MVVLSMPSRLDPGLAPDGQQVLHGYTPANEPWEIWKDLERGSPAYEALKQERCSVFHQVFEQLLPDWRERVVLELQGTPLSHRHWLRVHQGSYGPAWPADRGPFPGGSTPIEGLVLCGAGVFPGIGVPPVAIALLGVAACAGSRRAGDVGSSPGTADAAPDDISHFTNRAPYPILHLLREESIDRAVAAFPDAALIYERNMETLRALGHAGWQALDVGPVSGQLASISGDDTPP